MEGQAPIRGSFRVVRAALAREVPVPKEGFCFPQVWKEELAGSEDVAV